MCDWVVDDPDLDDLLDAAWERFFSPPGGQDGRDPDFVYLDDIDPLDGGDA